MEGVDSTMIYYKHFSKCHNVPSYNNNMIIKKVTFPNLRGAYVFKKLIFCNFIYL
jgi:hypothetical protein